MKKRKSRYEAREIVKKQSNRYGKRMYQHPQVRRQLDNMDHQEKDNKRGGRDE